MRKNKPETEGMMHVRYGDLPLQSDQICTARLEVERILEVITALLDDGAGRVPFSVRAALVVVYSDLKSARGRLVDAGARVIEIKNRIAAKGAGEENANG